MCENHEIVDDYCPNHVLNACYMIEYLCMLKSMQVTVLKMSFESNYGFY